MKHLTVYFLLALQGVLFSFSLSAATPQNAIAYHDGNVRFSVLTDGVIRMEWSPSGSFTDDPSFVAIHRNLPVPKYTVQNKNATDYPICKDAKTHVTIMIGYCILGSCGRKRKTKQNSLQCQ